MVDEAEAVAFAAEVVLLAARRGWDVDVAQVNSVRLVRLCVLLRDVLSAGRTEEGNG